MANGQRLHVRDFTEICMVKYLDTYICYNSDVGGRSIVVLTVFAPGIEYNIVIRTIIRTSNTIP